MNIKEDNQKKIMALTALALNFNVDLKKELLLVWLELLQGYSPDLVGKACKNVILTYQFKTLPPFAIIQKELDKLTGNSIEDKKNIPQYCWDEIDRALNNSPNKNVKPSLTPRAEHALRCIGGWHSLCLEDMDSLKWKKKEFMSVVENSIDVQEDMLSIGADNLTGFIKSLSENKKALA